MWFAVIFAITIILSFAGLALLRGTLALLFPFGRSGRPNRVQRCNPLEVRHLMTGNLHGSQLHPFFARKQFIQIHQDQQVFLATDNPLDIFRVIVITDIRR